MGHDQCRLVLGHAQAGPQGWQAAVNRRRKRIGQIIAALDGGASKASVCRSFKVPRSTLIDMPKRTGWSGAGAPAKASA